MVEKQETQAGEMTKQKERQNKKKNPKMESISTEVSVILFPKKQLQDRHVTVMTI